MRPPARRWIALVVCTASAAALAPAAEAGTYVVRQCDGAGAGLQPLAPDAAKDPPSIAYALRNLCAPRGGSLRVDNLQRTSKDRYGAWVYDAPGGTQLKALALQARLVSDGGHRASVYVRQAGAGQEPIAGYKGSDAWRGIEWRRQAAGGPVEFGARLICRPSSGNECRESRPAAAAIRNMRITLNDVAAPNLNLDGSLLGGGWRSGRQALAVSATDNGSGVRRVEVEANGATAAERTFECELTPGGDAAIRMRPCGASALASFDFDTSAAPFHEGLNSVQVCVEDFGSSSVNRTCESESVKIDNQAPGPPKNLSVVGGDGWRRVNDFDVTWENPEQAAGAGRIDGVYYAIEDADGTTVQGPALSPKADLAVMRDLDVPVPGEYTLKVWLRDQAGNATEANAAAVSLRFDDVAPGVASPSAPPGWISRRELSSFQQRWAVASSVPVSGVHGYAVAIDRFPNTNPCETATDPEPTACVGAEVTHPGADNRSTAVGDLGEGSHWAHVAAASGSGVRSSSVGRVELRVDRTDPVTELLGAPPEWTNRPATLVARSTDALSGMQPAAGDDGSPYTALRVDDGAPTSDPDNEVTRVLTEEGDHSVRYWARDLAGNATDGDPGGDGLPANGQPGSARVKIDATAPVPAFANSQHPADPELIRADVKEALSGIAGGEISYRRQGDVSWTGLTTEQRDGGLEARIDSESLPAGTYEFRASVRDRAGNEATTTRRADGTAMTLDLPLKTVSALSAGLGGRGDDELTVSYGRESLVSGRLSDAEGAPQPGETLAVTETFDLGSAHSTRTRNVITDGGGSYGLVLDAGPSRTVEVGFPGSDSHTRAAADPVELGVRGDAAMSTSKRRVRVGQRFRFRGRVKSLGARVPANGKLVELQVKRPEGWDTLRQAFRTGSSGSWRFPFRFGPYYLEPTTFRFRLKLTGEPGWPYRPATTKARPVTVTPR